MNRCRICANKTETRNVNLYICGSEGLDLCHECEMMIVEFVRHAIVLGSKGRKLGFQACKELHQSKEAVNLENNSPSSIPFDAGDGC